MWRIHRAIGMGGDQMIGALLGDDVEERDGDAIRDAEKERYFELIEEVQPLEGARGLIEDLKRTDHRVVLASSAKPDEVEHYLDLLDARGLADAWTSAGDVEQTKPAPDLVEAALERVGGRPAVMVGDSTWDCRAAANAGVETIAVLTGGFSEGELREAGALAVFESIDELRRRLSETPLG
jgi:HAD superfamily hydrolase (TIGR01549 family)